MKRQQKQLLGLILAVLLIAGAITFLELTKAKPIPRSELPAVKDGRYPLAPELSGFTGMVNTDTAPQLQDLQGKVVLVDFWTSSCVNCLRMFPHLNAWYAKYHDVGLEIVGVHSPEFFFERDLETVELAAQRYDINYPILQDNDFQVWQAYANQYWPHLYLIDSEGYLRYNHIGEGAYEQTEAMIQALLIEAGADLSGIERDFIEDRTPTQPVPSEIYLGVQFAFANGQNVGNHGGLQAGQDFNYQVASTLQEGVVYLSGLWYSDIQTLISRGNSAEESQLFIVFTASEMSIVAGSEQEVRMEVLFDGNPLTAEQAGADVEFVGGRSFVTISEKRVYELVSKEYSQGLVQLVVPDTDVQLYSISFG